MRPQKLTGAKGILCKRIDGKLFFRTHTNGSFRDYRIAHCDLDIEIQDEDAYAYKIGHEWVIDYGPKTLGVIHGTKKQRNKSEEK